jgi:hypothetical protein
VIVRGKLASVGVAVLAMTAITLSTSATASADDGTLSWPDPTDPYYWDANANAGGTGPAPQPTDDLYWKDGQDAGGTGNAAQPNSPEYTNQGENAGAV